ncbi:metal resistance protein YCF1 [Trametes maxima]|nr:metal resistance protein YCF1 [Trametes maxima]
MASLRTCRGDPEGWSPVSRIRRFDLTPCFEEGAVLSSLLAVYVLATIASCWVVRSRELRERGRKSLWILRAKQACSPFEFEYPRILLGLACATSCANLILIFVTNRQVVCIGSYALEIAALVIAPFHVSSNHRRTRTSSSVVLLFWPIYALAILVWARTILTISSISFLPVVIVRCVVTLLGLAAFALECLGPEFSEEDRPEQFVKGHVESPLLTANIFSKWSFMWMDTLMKKGASEYITEDDLPALVPQDEASALGDRLKKAMSKHSSLWTALFVAYGGPYAFALGLKFVQDSFAFLQPQLLRWLLSYISTYQAAKVSDRDPPTVVEGFAIAGIMFGASLIQTVFLHQYFQRCFETGMRIRSGLITAIYQKALILSNDGRSSASGDIVNLMSVDAMRLQDLSTYGLIAISGPFQITLAFISLYNILGWSAFAGVAIMIVSIPLNTVIARLLKKMQAQQMKNRDKRTRLMSDLLANIRSIKLYAWENAFMRWVFEVRNNQELKMLRSIGIVTSMNTSLWSGIPLLVAFSSFATAAYTSNTPLTSDKIFPAISLYMLLQFPLSMISQVTSNIIEAMVSVKRLSAFFESDELQPDVRKAVAKENVECGDVVVSIVNGEFRWNKDAPSATLEDINMAVRKGELVGILGRVGAGKTSLLSAIIGEMFRADGEVKVVGSISYAPQNPWVMSATIKDNILFSHKYDEEFYNIVLDACALRPDLALLPNGDMTEVGEKGLSGGQRARVALARAVYARADIVILDDVLAALDSHVAKHVFDHVIGPNGVLATKARIVVTNSIHFLKQFSQVLYMRRGVILECGSYMELVSNTQSELHKLVKGHGNLTASLTSGMSTPFITGFSATPSSEGDTAVESNQDLTEEKLETVDKTLTRRKSFGKAVIEDALPTRTASDGLTKEHTEQGRVKREVYLRYIEAASKTGFGAFVVATILQQIASLLGNNTLRSWGEHNREAGANAGAGVYLLGYGVFSLAGTLFGMAAAILIWVLCAVRSAGRLHDAMLNAIMHAPLSFFELTPTGRILNLFSRDTYVVDMMLARVIQGSVRTLCVTAMIVVVIGYSFPLFLIAVPPLAWFYVRVMVYYLATSRELKRLDAVSRSPIFAWFSESLNGLSTIRAFGQQQLFVASNERRVDRNQICYLPSISVNRWLAVRLEFVGSTIIFIAAILSIAALVTTGVDAGLVGFVLSYALNTTGSLNWLVRSASEVEQNIVSVERILHYIELPPEAPWEVPGTVPEDWPAKGEVEFRQYSARYRPELDLVLKDINVKIGASEKIGIVGRTGSGKSSLLLSLFRIIEPASGTIYIDGVDIAKVGLHDLRSAISIVPQSPDLFEGTIRENIDPTGASSDADIWVALEQTHLKAFVETLAGGLDATVREGGSSLSSGQRQLLCFARALLRKSKILVLDEATSAVDLDTDRAIQEIIRGPQFAHVTMLTIAHRVNTILESDRVLVLDAGKVIEFDAPKNLLANKQSAFHSLAVEAGLA